MKSLLTFLSLAALPTFVTAAEPLFVPPAGDYPAGGYAYYQPSGVQPQPIPEPHPSTPAPVVGMHPAPVMGQVVELYPNVRVKSPQHAHPCSVKEVVQVPNPCPRSGCCDPVFVEICVPPHCPPCVTYGPQGQRVTYAFGGYRVVVTCLRGEVTINYDRKLLL